MMMSRPRPEEKEAAAPVKTAPKKSSQQAVEDLERRLAMLGGASTSVAAPGVVSTDDEEDSGAAAAAAAATTKPEPSLLAQTTSSNSVKGGKNALLARIMAAQERAKKAQEHTAATTESAPPPVDLLSADPVVPTEGAARAAPPPPAFDAVDLPPPKQAEEPPPPFEAVQDDIMEQVQQPTKPIMSSPVLAPSAPAFEDLLDSSSQAAPAAPALEGISMVQPPEAASNDDELWGGLPEEERKALMDEQRKIMEQIEQEKRANAAAIAQAQAENFESRGGAPPTAQPVTAQDDDEASRRMVHLGGDQTVALHGQERTRAAIADGTAILVQCINCQNWMQVTDNATLMYCPVCSVVSPVIKQDSVMTRDEALQLSNDRKIAEQLQNEEYKEAARGEQEEEEEEESWWDSITSVFGVKKGTKPVSAIPVPREQVEQLQRGQIGTTRPPGLTPARTDEDGDEHDLLLQQSNVPAARVAERQPLFSCVVDSVSSAASTVLGTTQTLHEDREGNIHGVDASSLLSVTRASRDTQYQALPDEEEQR